MKEFISYWGVFSDQFATKKAFIDSPEREEEVYPHLYLKKYAKSEDVE